MNIFFSAGRKKREEAFARIYEEGYWTGGVSSGAGSTIEATSTARNIIAKIVTDYQISSIVDAACGDFTWMPLVLEQFSGRVRYTGCDIVPSLIEQHAAKYPQYSFRHLDFVADEIPPADLILCRDALQHLPVNDIREALKNFSGCGARYVLATTHMRRYGWKNRENMRPGRCRDRNLLLPPFNLPDPIVIYAERVPGQHKFLALWELPFTAS